MKDQKFMRLYKKGHPIFAVAPMMDWTDRHCRFFHRLLAPEALLYTEMITTAALVYGNAAQLLAFSPQEHPVALQLGGSDLKQLERAAQMGTQAGYDEINLNVGCPSDRVLSGAFGACLMKSPEKVAECVAILKAATHLPVTVKCRLGVDEQDTKSDLWRFVETVLRSGADALWVHARKAWLSGISPKDNRTLPPLLYERVYHLKEAFPEAWIGINGGITTLQQAMEHLWHVDGVMLGRGAYRNPALLCGVSGLLTAARARTLFPDDVSDPCLAGQKKAVERFKPYLQQQVAGGVSPRAVLKSLVPCFQGVRGAKTWRQLLTESLSGRECSPMALLERALACIETDWKTEPVAVFGH